MGIVGEVGSGKYSLVATFMRLGEVHGMLFMDGFDILKIGLHELRRNISVIPKVRWHQSCCASSSQRYKYLKTSIMQTKTDKQCQSLTGN